MEMRNIGVAKKKKCFCLFVFYGSLLKTQGHRGKDKK